MRRWLPGFVLALVWASPAPAAGLLLPADSAAPPLAMVDHKVEVAIDEQVALTKVEQTFRNPTDRPLEATYVFPVPKGASVNKFTMWVDGKEAKGELLEADKARSIYTDIVRRTQDPGLLEYMGNNLLRLRVFPVPARGDQKVALSFTAVNARDAGLVEYVYPLKTEAKTAHAHDKFTLTVTLKSQHAVQSVYSPTHAVTVKHKGDKQATVAFEQKQAALDKDFHLFYALGDKDVGLTALMHRPEKGADGHFLLLVAPRAELAKTQEVPRDMVFVLDTSGSMQGPKMEQARKALKFCLNNLGPKDRFAVLHFATTVNSFRAGLTPAGATTLGQARQWVDGLQATGGTAIDDALRAALDLRTSDAGRTFTVVFFTDGQPTVGETDPEKIFKNVAARNTAQTRVFTFGVGDDVNAALLDRLADGSRAVSTYVRPEEDMKVKVGGLYGKISHPVLTELKLSAGSGVTLSEMYPKELPDLFHGGQLVVMGRYKGQGHAALTLRGKVGEGRREFVYEVDFPVQTKKDKAFVADLWARRKVGYLLDQVRLNGEKKELIDEVVSLAKKHGIATPYTSYLVVPDSVPSGHPTAASPAVPPPTSPGVFIGSSSGASNTAAVGWPAAHKYRDGSPRSPAPAPAPPAATYMAACDSARPAPARSGEALALEQMRQALANGRRDEAQTGKLGVDLALQLNSLRNQDRLSRAASQVVAGRNCVQVGAGWVDDGFDAKMKRVAVKAQSKAYFRILERHPSVKEVFQLGNQVVWVTPNKTALVIDAAGGKEELSDKDIDGMFVSAK